MAFPKLMDHKKTRGYGVMGIVVHIVIFLLLLLIIWLLTQRQVSGVESIAWLLEQAGYVDVQALKIGRTLVLGIINLIPLIFSLLEFLLKFHNPHRPNVTGKDKKYKWYVGAISIYCIGVVAILIASGVMLADFWIILTQLLALAIAVFVPRIITGSNI